jgi:hypothetical protein
MILARFESTEQGTFGRLGRWWTVERTEMLLAVGTYKVIWTRSPRLRRFTYRLLGTEPRTGILIHPANLATQLLGCIALGERIGWMDGVKCVLISRPSVSAFEDSLKRQPFELEVTSA